MNHTLRACFAFPLDPSSHRKTTFQAVSLTASWTVPMVKIPSRDESKSRMMRFLSSLDDWAPRRCMPVNYRFEASEPSILTTEHQLLQGISRYQSWLSSACWLHPLSTKVLLNWLSLIVSKFGMTQLKSWSFANADPVVLRIRTSL